ncbi:30S ribosomal protein S11 [Candidatus Parcubacteria bacterium]|jgi:small subunit ribosomal protein S11|nr:MAG: 30S ribosomal protein S11 [Candidatus Parcubacteria bacterium]
MPEISENLKPEKAAEAALADQTKAGKTEAPSGVVLPARRKRKAKKFLTHGIVHIQATYNNTIVSISDLNGNVLGWSSAGSAGFKGPKKGTPYAAGIVVKNLLEKLREVGLKQVDVRVRGIGSGREAAIRALAGAGLSINGIKDITPIPHNGVRPPKVRRV